MKKVFIISILLLFIKTSFAQPATDIIVKHTGERLNVKIISVDEKIVFIYPGETANQTVFKNCVREIIFSSGRVQEITEKIIIKGEDDWEKVVITSDPEEVKCLVRKGDVRSSASNSWNFKSKKGVDKKATMKIQKEAAELKACFILITDQTKKNETIFSGASSDKYGVAYGYE
jgi:hypothetical protein